MRSYFSVLVLKIHHIPLSFVVICWQSQPRSSMCTHVTTEHQDMNPSRMDVPQPTKHYPFQHVIRYQPNLCGNSTELCAPQIHVPRPTQRSCSSEPGRSPTLLKQGTTELLGPTTFRPPDRTRFNQIRQKRLRRLIWFSSILDYGHAPLRYIYSGN
jgi:hypothetical protein